MEKPQEKLPWWVTTKSFTAALVVVIAWTVAFILRAISLTTDEKVTGFDWFITGTYLFLALAWTPTVIYQWRRKKQLQEAGAEK